MLSILIPVYNQDVTKLVKTLMKQAEKLKIDYEILVYDDGSKDKYKIKNSILSDIFKVNYLELSENLGRAKIRNWLAKSARYDTLIFLDCDSKVVSKDFIGKYTAAIGKADLISGGRIYNKKPPRAVSKMLHWKYGVKRESKSAAKRNQQKIAYFHTNNFMLNRDAIIKYPFDDAIKGYGYEDILFAQKLYEKGYAILHIDNPIEHLGLEKSKVFIEKKMDGERTLAKMQKGGSPFENNFIKWYEKLNNWGLDKRLAQYCEKNMNKIMENLNSNKPKLYYFDLLRIYHHYNAKKQ